MLISLAPQEQEQYLCTIMCTDTSSPLSPLQVSLACAIAPSTFPPGCYDLVLVTSHPSHSGLLAQWLILDSLSIVQLSQSVHVTITAMVLPFFFRCVAYSYTSLHSEPTTRHAMYNNKKTKQNKKARNVQHQEEPSKHRSHLQNMTVRRGHQTLLISSSTAKEKDLYNSVDSRMESDIPNTDTCVGPSSTQAACLAFRVVDPKDSVDPTWPSVVDGDALQRASH